MGLRKNINQREDGKPQTLGYEHLIHCLDVLRDSVMCNADDTLMYVGRLHGNTESEHPRAGLGQYRMCRDWNGLLDWTREHSACYRRVEPHNESFPEIERYKFCPDGSRPWEDPVGAKTE